MEPAKNFKKHIDAAHGWLEVSNEVLFSIIGHEIPENIKRQSPLGSYSHYSYKIDDSVKDKDGKCFQSITYYLEEDEDAQQFIKMYESIFGPITVEEVIHNEPACFVQNLPTIGDMRNEGKILIEKLKEAEKTPKSYKYSRPIGLDPSHFSLN